MKGVSPEAPGRRRFARRHAARLTASCNSEAPSLIPWRTMIDGGQPAQHDHRHGVRHIAPHGTRGHLVGNGASGERVVAVDTLVLIGHHESAAGTAQLVSQGAPLQPLVEKGLATREFIDPM
jgi:hypothetical protein